MNKLGLFDFLKPKIQPKSERSIRLVDGSDFADFIASGSYVSMDNNPEVVSACLRISQLIASMTIYLMANTEKGDKRITNELSRKIDISPNDYMTRSSWMTAIVMNLLLYGRGNSVVYPHTKKGKLANLEPIEASRVSFSERVGAEGYSINIDGKSYDPMDLLHFTFNPDKDHLWMGSGYKVVVKDLVDNLSQAHATEKAFMSSKFQPPIIVKVDGMIDEFSSPEGRNKLLESYVGSNKKGEPWLIPADQFQVEQVRPLSLTDLAINESVEINKKTIASLLGVPSFVLGVGEYNSAEWDSFVNNTIRPIAQNIEQELTRKLLISPKMYLMFNMSRLYSYDLQKLANVYGSMYDKGIVTKNEVREKLNYEHVEGGDEFVVLENYIPANMIGNQKKLKDGDE